MFINIINQIFDSENNFFKLAQHAKRLPHVAFSSFLLPILFIIVPSLIVEFVITPLIIGDIHKLTNFWKQLYILCVLFPSIIFVLFVWVKIVEKRPFYTIGFTKDKVLIRYLFGFGTGFLMMSVIVVLIALTGSIGIVQKGITGFQAISGVLLFLFGYIIQGGTEEIVSRGWQFQVISTKYKPWLGVLVSALLFALLHSMNPGVNVLCIINLFLFAVLLVLYVMNDGSIWSACGWHSAWNWTMGNVFGLQISGGTGRTTSLFNLSASGPVILTGGAFGPEGSIFTTLVLSTGIFLMAHHIYRKGRF